MQGCVPPSAASARQEEPPPVHNHLSIGCVLLASSAWFIDIITLMPNYVDTPFEAGAGAISLCAWLDIWPDHCLHGPGLAWWPLGWQNMVTGPLHRTNLPPLHPHNSVTWRLSPVSLGRPGAVLLHWAGGDGCLWLTWSQPHFHTQPHRAWRGICTCIIDDRYIHSSAHAVLTSSTSTWDHTVAGLCLRLLWFGLNWTNQLVYVGSCSPLKGWLMRISHESFTSF